MKDSGITERNKEKVRYLMNLSFEMRRNKIVKEPQPLEELLQKFPFLKHPEEVHMHVNYKSGLHLGFDQRGGAKASLIRERGEGQ